MTTPYITIFVLFVALLVCIYQSQPTTMANHAWKYEAMHKFFSHDDDPESWEFRATTRPGLGILQREYPTDAGIDPAHQLSNWARLRHYVKSLNKEDPENRRYKMLYIVRHGEGVHNVKEKEVGRQEWDVSA